MEPHYDKNKINSYKIVYPFYDSAGLFKSSPLVF